MKKSLLDQLKDFKTISARLIKEKKEKDLRRLNGCKCHKCTECRWRSMRKLNIIN